MTTKFFSFFLVLLISLGNSQVRGQCSTTVQRGSRGECVRVVQRAVGVDVDGMFGRNTKAAVEKYQSERGLVADGIVGRNTWAAINGNNVTRGSRIGIVRSNSCGCSYDYAGKTCSTGPTQGAKNLGAFLTSRYGGRFEIFNCRKVRGGRSLSLHAEGRAVDWFPGSQQVFNDMISMACSSGIQEVIYNRKIWTQGRGTRAYSGVNPHTDHVHIGLNRCGARNFS